MWVSYVAAPIGSTEINAIKMPNVAIVLANLFDVFIVRIGLVASIVATASIDSEGGILRISWMHRRYSSFLSAWYTTQHCEPAIAASNIERPTLDGIMMTRQAIETMLFDRLCTISDKPLAGTPKPV